MFRPVDETDALSALEYAWQSGVRYFDTAPHYGVGLAEQRLGHFLHDRSRAEFVVSTKVGRLLVPGHGQQGEDSYWGGPDSLVRRRDYSRDGVLRSIDDSLRRTGLDRFDIVLIHDPEGYERDAFERAYPTLERLRAEGVVSAIGVGLNQWQLPLQFVRETDIDVVLVAGRYSLLDRTAETELLPACQERGVGVIAAGVFNSGVLAAPDSRAHFDYDAVPSAILRRALEMKDLCESRDIPLVAAATQFPLRHPAVSAVLLGARNGAELQLDLGCLGIAVPDALWGELEGMSFVR